MCTRSFSDDMVINKCLVDLLWFSCFQAVASQYQARNLDFHDEALKVLDFLSKCVCVFLFVLVTLCVFFSWIHVLDSTFAGLNF